MRRFTSCWVTALLIVCAFSACQGQEEEWTDEFATRLGSLPNVVQVTREESPDFAAKYKVIFEQPLDHDHASAGTFRQLVYVCLTNPDAPNVLLTEGYYAFDAQSRHELSQMLGGNQIVVEHRYYGESTIADATYRYNDAQNSCDDLHAVVTALRGALPGKWVSTGRSKSGLTSNMYRAFYPQDVDVTVAYGAPFCQSRYDGRMAEALQTTIGTAEGRERLIAYQREMMKRRKVMVQKWDSTATAQGVALRQPADWMLDLNLMDLMVDFWAYGYDVNGIPAPSASDDELFAYMISLSGPDAWDVNNDVCKYYTEAYKELGHYALPTAGVEDLLVVGDDVRKDFLKYTYVPTGVEEVFSETMHKKVEAFLHETDAPYIFIYGGWDPWCAVGIGPEYVRGNIHRYVLPTGCHATKIADFDAATQAEIRGLLEGWLR